MIYRASRLEALLDPLLALMDSAPPEHVLQPHSVIAAHPGLEFSSLPFRGRDDQAPHIEFGFKAAEALAASAYRQFEAGLKQRGAKIEPCQSP